MIWPGIWMKVAKYLWLWVFDFSCISWCWHQRADTGITYTMSVCPSVNLSLSLSMTCVILSKQAWHMLVGTLLLLIYFTHYLKEFCFKIQATKVVNWQEDGLLFTQKESTGQPAEPMIVLSLRNCFLRWYKYLVRLLVPFCPTGSVVHTLGSHQCSRSLILNIDMRVFFGHCGFCPQ